MKLSDFSIAKRWMKAGPGWLPFADAGSTGFPMGQLIRLSMFQVSTGITAVLLIGTLNRVMIVELGVPAALVSLMVALPLVFAPLRALIGFRSDTHLSVLGWRRVPYIWFGAVVQFSGLSIMPFALLILSGDTTGPMWASYLAAAIAFLLVGAGMHTVQTVGLALATDLAPREKQPQVVALLSAMLLVGMVIAAIGYGLMLSPFSQLKLIQVIQGTAVATGTMILIAMWQQEPRRRGLDLTQQQPSFGEAWRTLRGHGAWGRRLVAAGLGSFAFSMQDVLLEPYGGQILDMSVSETTLLTALLAGGGIIGFVLAARVIRRGSDAHRIAGLGALCGTVAFAAVAMSAPVESTFLFCIGVSLIGFGAGLFAHGTLTACMQAAPPDQVGLALGAWGAVQATCAGAALALGGVIRDVVAGLAADGSLGPALQGPAVGYVSVYLIEIVLLFATLAAIGPLVRRSYVPVRQPLSPLGFSGQVSLSSPSWRGPT